MVYVLMNYFVAKNWQVIYKSHVYYVGNMHVLTGSNSLEESRRWKNVIDVTLGLAVVSKLIKDEQSFKYGVVILVIFIFL